MSSRQREHPGRQPTGHGRTTADACRELDTKRPSMRSVVDNRRGLAAEVVRGNALRGSRSFAREGGPSAVAAENAGLLDLDIDRYRGGVALWGAVPAVYDTTMLPLERGIHVHARLSPRSRKELDNTCGAVRLRSTRLPPDGLLVRGVDAICFMIVSVLGSAMAYIECPCCGDPYLDKRWFSQPLMAYKPVCERCGSHLPRGMAPWGYSASKHRLPQDRSCVGAGHHAGVSGQIPIVDLGRRALPDGAAFGEFRFGDFELDLAIGHVDADEVARLDEGDGPAGGGLGADVADARAAGGAAEAAVGDERDALA